MDKLSTPIWVCVINNDPELFNTKNKALRLAYAEIDDVVKENCGNDDLPRPLNALALRVRLLQSGAVTINIGKDPFGDPILWEITVTQCFI
tara:strand:+ start:55 stop:327 length:273 start_codon:yes stop_codon:yes gene_type:complete